MLTFIFCDDNEQFMDIISNYTREECLKIFQDESDITIEPMFTHGVDALHYVQENNVDAIFLDIDMPEFSGFDVAKILCTQYKNTKIIFVSGYDNYVYSSFDFQPFAFLRKNHIQEDLPTQIINAEKFPNNIGIHIIPKRK